MAVVWDNRIDAETGLADCSTPQGDDEAKRHRENIRDTRKIELSNTSAQPRKSILTSTFDNTKLTGDKSPRTIVDNDPRSVQERLHDLREHVKKGKFLSLNDELFCGRLVRKGEEEGATRTDKIRRERAAEILTIAYQRLVYRMASQMYKNMPQGTTLEDCVAAGTAGLARAIQGYDPSKGFKLGTYATSWVRHFLQRFSHTIARPGHVPQGKLMAVANVHRQMEAVKQEEGNERGTISEERLGKILEDNGLTMYDYRKTSQFNLGAMSIDSHVGEESDGHSMGEMLRGDEIESSTMGSWSINDVESTMDKNGVSETLRKGIASLSEKQQAIVTAMYLNPLMGVNGEIHKTNAAARREAGLKKSEADRELAAAMKALRETLMNEGYTEEELKR